MNQAEADERLFLDIQDAIRRAEANGLTRYEVGARLHSESLGYAMELMGGPCEGVSISPDGIAPNPTTTGPGTNP